MNPLQEHAHLFANGKFKASFKGLKFKILGIKHKYDCAWLINNATPVDNLEASECTLIARPIEDMTDEEKQKWKSFIYEADGNMIPVYAKQTEYLLSIGVYPFDQSHFEEGHVIDSREAL